MWCVGREDEFWLNDLIVLGVMELLVNTLREVDEAADDGKDDEQDAAILVGVIMCLYELATQTSEVLTTDCRMLHTYCCVSHLCDCTVVREM